MILETMSITYLILRVLLMVVPFVSTIVAKQVGNPFHFFFSYQFCEAIFSNIVNEIYEIEWKESDGDEGDEDGFKEGRV